MVPLRDPNSIARDSAGNLYIADVADNRIRKISNGIITTYAGTGLPGYSGDRGPATAAQLSGPVNIAMDSKDNLFIADRDNFVVRRVSPDGIINTVAGNGQRGFGGEGGTATAATLEPAAVATDARGNLYIADYTNRIVKVDSNGILTIIAGTGKSGSAPNNSAAVAGPVGLVISMATDAHGNLYFADYANFFVRKIDANGIVTTVAGMGGQGYIDEDIPATEALILPAGIALDASGNTLYVSDLYLDVIRKVDLVAGIIETVVGSGSVGFSGESGQASLINLNFPTGILVDPSGAVYFADRFNFRIRKLVQFQVTTVAGTNSGDGKSATAAFLNFPTGVAIDATNHLGIADDGNVEFRVATLGGSITSAGQVNGPPLAAAVDSSGNFFVADSEPLVLKITPSGTTVKVAGNGTDAYDGDQSPAVGASISSPTGVAVDTAGNVYITDFIHNRVRKVTAATGIITTIAGNGSPVFTKDDVPATSTGIDPYDVAVDAAFNVYIADQINNRIRKISTDRTITTVAGNGSPGYSGDGGYAIDAQLSLPSGIALDRTGNLYIADFGNSVVRLVTTGGLIRTIAGNGTIAPASGDGGPARAAAMNPVRLALDSRGNIYVSDLSNDRVRMLTPKAAIPAACRS
jgi:sugar lactone lactonase YvrE